ncbi:hypothetical protein C8R44DRAFT_985144 [Mycena epipterygia]|nr:hypothetical protein C8R44DRAFT_985144 [Mycena epipterygia]
MVRRVSGSGNAEASSGSSDSDDEESEAAAILARRAAHQTPASDPKITKVIEIILDVPAISIFRGELRLFFPLSLTVLILHRLFSIRITFWVNINNYYLSFDTHSGPQRPRNISIASQFPVPVLDIVPFAVNIWNALCFLHYWIWYDDEHGSLRAPEGLASLKASKAGVAFKGLVKHNLHLKALDKVGALEAPAYLAMSDAVTVGTGFVRGGTTTWALPLSLLVTDAVCCSPDGGFIGSSAGNHRQLALNRHVASFLQSSLPCNLSGTLSYRTPLNVDRIPILGLKYNSHPPPQLGTFAITYSCRPASISSPLRCLPSEFLVEIFALCSPALTLTFTDAPALGLSRSKSP